MTILNTLKYYINKDDFDWGRKDITLQLFHPQFELFFAINGIFFSNRESIIRFIWPVLSTLITLIATAFEMMFIWRGITIRDYNFATECFCYFFILGSVSIVYSSVLLNRPRIFELLNNMNNDFVFICGLGREYRKCFLDGQLLIWKLCWYWLIFICWVASLYIANTVVYLLWQSIFATLDEHTVRPLMFPIWLPKDDPHRTPNYEVFMTFEIILIFIVICTFGLYVYILFHLLLHYYNLINVILIALEELFDGLDESVATLPREDPRRVAVQSELNARMGQIARWHLSIFDSVDTISSVYGPMLVYQVMFSSVVICLMAYQVSEQLSAGKFDYLFGILTFGACVQLWIPCYIGTLLRTKALSLADACFYCGWHTTPLALLVRHDLIIFILRAQQPVAIKFTGLPELQLETFSSIMSTAYSYFNMLRQYNSE
ncbi:odorant receptor Or2-like [Cydia amplana]|uniref:odorant receptor Or2-like n=1 Tax=Cydia amplana TaxID=1869771 RepID=UPI002FE6083D